MFMAAHDHVILAADVDAVVALPFGGATDDLRTSHRVLAVEGVSVA